MTSYEAAILANEDAALAREAKGLYGAAVIYWLKAARVARSQGWTARMTQCAVAAERAMNLARCTTPTV